MYFLFGLVANVLSGIVLHPCLQVIKYTTDLIEIELHTCGCEIYGSIQYSRSVILQFRLTPCDVTVWNTIRIENTCLNYLYSWTIATAI